MYTKYFEIIDFFPVQDYTMLVLQNCCHVANQDSMRLYNERCSSLILVVSVSIHSCSVH